MDYEVHISTDPILYRRLQNTRFTQLKIAVTFLIFVIFTICKKLCDSITKICIVYEKLEQSGNLKNMVWYCYFKCGQNDFYLMSFVNVGYTIDDMLLVQRRDA